jgi:rfaE bifunctional protein kinase chain/domain
LGVKEVFPLTVVGRDWQGKIFQEELKKNEINPNDIIVSGQRVTSTYIKPILCGLDSQQEDSRLDFVNYNPLGRSLEESLIKNVRMVLSKVDAVIIEDQMVQNGIVTASVRDSLIQLAEENTDKIFAADSREHIGLFRNMVLKPNLIEAVRAIYPLKNPQEIDMDDLVGIGKKLQKQAKRPVYITLSEKGALLITESAQHHLLAAPAKPPIDPVGAGDTFISAITASLAGGANPMEAGIIANLAAGVVVKKLNITGTASPEEILKKFDESYKTEEG